MRAILPQPADAQIFGTMHIPRFGPDYNVSIAGGVTRSGTLDPIGIGHYPGTMMPGEIGNFANRNKFSCGCYFDFKTTGRTSCQKCGTSGQPCCQGGFCKTGTCSSGTCP